MNTAGKIWGPRVGVAVVAAGLALGGSMSAAHAQFVCGEAGTGDAAGATATGGQSVACGPDAIAFGDFTTAIGDNPSADGPGATAIGQAAAASGRNATAIGRNAFTRGGGTTAIGAEADAIGNGATAIGSFARAEGDGATATGVLALATADQATALGNKAVAEHVNAAAIGAGARTERDNQMVFGTESNTYTMRGITSEASKAAQQGPLEVVTTDKNGNLASDGGALFKRVDGVEERVEGLQQQIQGFQGRIDALGERDRELADGIAIALAIQQPIFQPGQSFAMRAGYGNFDGNNAFGLSAAGVIDRGSFGRGSSVTLDAGIGFGTATGTGAGRAGVTFGW